MTLSARVRVSVAAEGCAFCGSESDEGERLFVVSFSERAVVEHKAQTHFEGFALLSHLLCVGYPAAHMYL